ncbi:Methyltransferase FkbM [Burkholderiales bacterium]
MIKQKFRRSFNIPIRYQYSGFDILLPADHQLPAHQLAHPKYDRFLPHLGKHLESSDLVVDIGANIGDTLAGMYEANPTLRFICVEADDYFFSGLENNIQRIKDFGHHLEVKAVKALIGKSISAVTLEGQGGTKHAVVGTSGGIHPIPLDELLAGDDISSLRLLKTDVDGFDYDVLDSSMTLIVKSQPMIFFELQYDNYSQYESYLRTIQQLTSLGYDHWFIFDNFGSLILRTRDLSTLRQLMAYVQQQNLDKTTRTIYYFDILTARDADVPNIDRALETY